MSQRERPADNDGANDRATNLKSTRTIASEWVTYTLPDGRRALAWLPVIPEDAPYKIREGIARRRLAAIEGVCPCGAVANLEAARVGRVRTTEIWHDRTCPADTERLEKLIRRWLR